MTDDSTTLFAHETEFWFRLWFRWYDSIVHPVYGDAWTESQPCMSARFLPPMDLDEHDREIAIKQSHDAWVARMREQFIASQATK